MKLFQINSSIQKLPISHSFTDDQIRDKAYKLWKKRGNESSSEENWTDAIQELVKEQQLKKILKPIHRLWWWTGLERPIQFIWKWTGFQNKTGWDFLQLLVAPIFLTVIAVGLQEYVKQKDTQQSDIKIKQDTLTKYFDQMNDLVEGGLLKSKIGSDKFIIAQIKTVMAIQSLDKTRQHLVIQFLESSGFNNTSEETDPQHPDKWNKLHDRVLLYQAEMSKANLINSDLSGAALIEVNFESANLGCDSKGQCSDLSDCDFRGAILQNAILKGANLRGASFAEGADLSNTDIKDADIKDAHFEAMENYKGAEEFGLTIAQVKSAKNWEQAHYSPEFRQKLGLPPEKKP